MKKLRKYLITLFIAITIPMALIMSVMDSIFEILTSGVKQAETMYIALILYFAATVGIYVIGVCLFTRFVSKRIKEENARYYQEKSMLFANIAHDLKTPLTTITGFSKALFDGTVSDAQEQRELLDSIYSKSKRANELLDVMFQYTKLSGNDYKLNMEKQDIGCILREVTAAHYNDFESRGMNVDFNIPDSPVYCEVDKLEISRALSNLIINAYKHNENGSSIMISLVEDEKINIIVADNGRQISEKQKEVIFEPFICGDESRNSKGGSGLGLAIAKMIVEKHGGKLYTDSNIENYTKGFLIKL